MKATENFRALTTNKDDFERERSFSINSLGWLTINNEDCFLNRVQDNNRFEIVWLIKGSGIHDVDMRKYIVGDNSLFFVKPGQVHRLHLNGSFEGYMISFAESFLCMDEQETNSTYHSSLFNMFASANAISVDAGVAPDMKDIVDRMIREFDSHNLFRAEMLRRYFKIFLIYISRQLEGRFYTGRQTRNMEIVQQFMRLVERHYKEQKMVSDYAAMLSVTPNYLNEIIKKTTGFSAGHHIRQRVVLEAKRQAAYSGNCMKEIAYRLGFCDMAHFSKYFKNTTGINFSEFKKDRFIVSPVSLL